MYDASNELVVFFKDTATAEIYTLSLHDALPIYMAQRHVVEPGIEHIPPQVRLARLASRPGREPRSHAMGDDDVSQDRKSTRLNSSHANISYAVFCLKKTSSASNSSRSRISRRPP